MNAQDQTFDEDTFGDDTLDNPWPALGWIVLAAATAITAFLLAPLP
jgi:hypothetical protein